MRIRDKDVRVSWGEFAFASFIAVVAAYYLYDITSVSMHTNNIILVVPLTLLLLALYVVLDFKCLTFTPVDTADAHTVAPSVDAAKDADAAPNDAPQSRIDTIRAFVLLVGIGLYVSTSHLIGLDIATFMFVAASMYLLGVRGKILIPVYALIFTFVVIGGAHLLLYYPIPMAFM